MPKEKRTKPCSNCKKSKVKCIYTASLPCERCMKTGQAVNCQFVPKLPSLKLPLFTQGGPPYVIPAGPNNISITPNMPGIPAPPSIPPAPNMALAVPTQPPISNMVLSNHHPDPEGQWKSHMENRINSFDDKLNDLVDILKSNQQMLLEQQRNPYNPVPMYQSPLQPSIPNKASHLKRALEPPLISSASSSSSTSPELPRKRLKSATTLGDAFIGKDFRDTFLSKDEAKELFHFFDANISQQLFGFEISRFSVDSIWATSPVLVCAISTIASIHHPKLSGKSEGLKAYLQDLCGSLLYRGKPKNEEEGFNTIVALILCSFWLSDSQMFTGLALQLAKEYGLNNPYTENKDKLKLWYLLYVLDGQQSLTLNRQPLVNSQEYSLVHSKEILLPTKQLELKGSKPESNLIKQDEKDNSTTKEHILKKRDLNADMRLVSQVEYNQALNEAFKGNAWDLLVPSSFGIPSKSNLELDKWMVSWTVLLAPSNNGAVWSSKSTLIYYNFAKMHINSSAVRQLQVNPNKMLPKWDSMTHTATSSSERPSTSPSRKSALESDDSEDSDSDDDTTNEDEFISNKGLLSEDETTVNANIAINAAQTVLNLVINDHDILDNLKYVPVHIHIMLYYASLLLLNPPMKSNNKAIELDPYTYNLKIIGNLKIIKMLEKKIYNNLPIDTNFGDRLIRSLDEIVEEKLIKVRKDSEELQDGPQKVELLKQIDSLIESSNDKNIVELADDSTISRGSTPPGPERISAWPGSNHGHP
ncbi:uncharacterized protein CANTADRAFT_50377 [Suhomyces tanzawaensis NRRL Y-17324]|uniref:Zn(2)-C6 fungal-type domain-containing protein n=1 Tax=Suhomyces tanzawaensis NRRL Y-17324 TaxID=984487 RepID=A0A1E4SL23_9ASCO|nr:uncharacterized protein CANTADRAFT_50377 [Suhomyces tanzawaensis NRRL Y-17324]ODV80206.1 hypothetical protein CANTADRAFT_50377 [Suhomyces tanzawaensis NRRL Y-17324]